MTTSLARLREEAAGCTDCPLYEDATQTVFGAGGAGAALMLVGEQPGDREDVEGEPFVGPAGGLLDRALADADIPRDEVFVTNVVKHFKFVRKGKRRIHQKPNAEEIAACRQWLDGELEVVEPAVVVALGATAAKSLIDRSFRVTRQHGELVDRDGRLYTGTLHPAAILRSRDDEDRRAKYTEFVQDLKTAAAAAFG